MCLPLAQSDCPSLPLHPSNKWKTKTRSASRRHEWHDTKQHTDDVNNQLASPHFVCIHPSFINRSVISHLTFRTFIYLPSFYLSRWAPALLFIRYHILQKSYLTLDGPFGILACCAHLLTPVTRGFLTGKDTVCCRGPVSPVLLTPSPSNPHPFHLQLWDFDSPISPSPHRKLKMCNAEK